MPYSQYKYIHHSYLFLNLIQTPYNNSITDIDTISPSANSADIIDSFPNQISFSSIAYHRYPPMKG